jgi:hypothetical protein
MTTLASSSARFGAGLDRYRQRCLAQHKVPSKEYINMFETLNDEARSREEDPEWQKNNLEYDLRSTPWILEKVKEDRYAQNLYAAMCNMRWQKRDIFPILKDEYWHCSWRYSGGIVADMRGEGDYMDWYCSGIRGEVTQETFDSYTEDEKLNYKISQTFVSEGVVTDEIEEDLLKLGWQKSEWPDDNVL